MSWGLNNELECDGWCRDESSHRSDEITHIDEKGYIYCQPCGEIRQSGGRRCRKLRPHELARLRRGQPMERY